MGSPEPPACTDLLGLDELSPEPSTEAQAAVSEAQAGHEAPELAVLMQIVVHGASAASSPASSMHAGAAHAGRAAWEAEADLATAPLGPFTAVQSEGASESAMHRSTSDASGGV